jgi:hypothetical protein
MADNPGPRPADGGADQPADDDVFAELVARFDDEPAEHTWPAAEDVPAGPAEDADATRPAAGSALVAGAGPAEGVDDEPGTVPPTVAGADGLAAGGPAAGPAGRDLLDDAVGRGLAEGTGRRRPDGAETPATAPDPRRAGSDDDGADELDEVLHYIAPPPPKAGWVRPATGFALGAIALGVLILVAPALADRATSGAGEIAGVAFILGGVGALVARLSERPPTDDEGPDNGAVL